MVFRVGMAAAGVMGAIAMAGTALAAPGGTRAADRAVTRSLAALVAQPDGPRGCG